MSTPDNKISSQREIPKPRKGGTYPDRLPIDILPRRPVALYSELEIINSLNNNGDRRLGYAAVEIGRGYVNKYVPYLKRLADLNTKGKTMSKTEFQKWCNDVAEIMYDGRFNQEGVVTICILATNKNDNQKNLAITGRVVFEDLETPELIHRPKARANAELGRIVVAQHYRGVREGDDVNQSTELVHTLIGAPQGVVDIAQRMGAKKISTLGKNEFVRHTRGSQIDFGKGRAITLTDKGKETAGLFGPHWYDSDDPMKQYVGKIPQKD